MLIINSQCWSKQHLHSHWPSSLHTFKAPPHPLASHGGTSRHPLPVSAQSGSMEARSSAWAPASLRHCPVPRPDSSPLAVILLAEALFAPQKTQRSPLPSTDHRCHLCPAASSSLAKERASLADGAAPAPGRRSLHPLTRFAGAGAGGGGSCKDADTASRPPPPGPPLLPQALRYCASGTWAVEVLSLSSICLPEGLPGWLFSKPRGGWAAQGRRVPMHWEC